MKMLLACIFGALTLIFVGCSTCDHANEKALTRTSPTESPTAQLVATNSTDDLGLVLDLKDGSHIVGRITPKNSPLTIRTESIGDLKIAFDHIRGIQFTPGNLLATLSLKNGDKLQGVFTQETFKLTTDFGKVLIPLSLITRLTVSQTHGAGPTEGLVLYYPLDSDDKSAYRDNSPNHINSYLYGCRFVAGSGGVEFNGQGDCITIPHDGNFGFAATGQFTLAAWVRPVAKAGMAHAILVKAPYSGGFEWGLYVDQEGHFMSGWERNHVVRSKSICDSTTWSHVAVTYKNGTWNLYVNGEIEATATDRQITPTDGGLAIGRKGAAGAFTDFYQGLIRDVRIYNHALSSEEVRTLSKL